jgi:TRAP-type C4-dicarboxylate transport system permease large subunit
MIYVIIGVSLIFGSLAFILTKDNAQYLLAGYNTMSKEQREQREQIDIEAYLKMFKQAHITLAISTLVLGVVTLLWFGDRSAALFISIYPLLFYGYFFFKMYPLFKQKKLK